MLSVWARRLAFATPLPQVGTRADQTTHKRQPVGEPAAAPAAADHSAGAAPLSGCYGLAADGNKSATCRPSPRRGAEENGKKQAETGGSG